MLKLDGLNRKNVLEDPSRSTPPTRKAQAIGDKDNKKSAAVCSWCKKPLEGENWTRGLHTYCSPRAALNRVEELHSTLEASCFSSQQRSTTHLVPKTCKLDCGRLAESPVE
jgi:hypothetical protein